MTAIDKFIRLEAVGWWFEAGRQEAREVIVSFGDATLQITSLKDVPLTHWSLLATKRIGTRGETVMYSADPEQHEVLEIDDPDMIRAISAVTSALTAPPPKQKTRWVWRGVGLAIVLGALSQSSPLIYGVAGLTTPPARLQEVSLTMRKQAGLVCKGWLGQRALESFSAALFPEQNPPKLTVIDGLNANIIALPNREILIADQALESLSTEALATRVIAAWAYAQNGGTKSALIKSLGPFGALRYLVSGRFPAPLPIPADRALSAEDYLLARDHLLALGVSPNGLQSLASTQGLGLPLPQLALPKFQFSAYKTLQGICAE
ncbi:MAG: hypothetical protein COB08_018015 [Rhodobacteraceae bacterium]|nr:hypothetical protein [Paracoccaceae bacterium]